MTITLACGKYVEAQQFLVSRAYGMPSVLSPAYVGSGLLPRASVMVRQQWVGIEKGIITYATAFDMGHQDTRHAFGGYVWQSTVSDKWRYQNVMAQYSYTLLLPYTLNLRMGLQAGYARQAIIDPSLTTPSGLNVASGQHSSGADPILSGGGVMANNLFEAGMGACLYTDWVWATANLTKINSISGLDDAFMMLQTGAIYHMERNPKMRLHKSRDEYIGGAAHLRRQAGVSQWDLWLMGCYDPISLSLGYRGMPGSSRYGITRNESVIISLGLHFRNIHLGYSYDIPSTAYNGQNGGSHEVMLRYVPSSSLRDDDQRRLVMHGHAKNRRRALAFPVE